MTDEKNTKQEKDQSSFRKRSSDYQERYANNVYFEPSLWDLKLIFGGLDQSSGFNIVSQHTGMTLPWSQVKLLIYFLRFHLIGYEAQQGRVTIRPGFIAPIPPELEPSIEPDITVAAEAVEAYGKLRRLYEEFISENPEAEIHDSGK